MPAFITPYISQWMTVKSPPYCASQMDKQKNIIVLSAKSPLAFILLKAERTTCLYCFRAIHSSISHLRIFPPSRWCTCEGWDAMFPGGVKKKRMHGWISPEPTPQRVYNSRKDKKCMRRVFILSFGQVIFILFDIYLFIYLFIWKSITLLGQG